MRRFIPMGIVTAGFTLAGCQMVHTSQPDGVPVAIWVSTTLIDLKGQPPPAEVHETVTRVLRDRGLHPAVDDAGLCVPAAEETRAREALLTDRRLAGSGVEVLLIIPAGTGRRTPTGFDVPAVAPKEPVRIPTTIPTTEPATMRIE